MESHPELTSSFSFPPRPSPSLDSRVAIITGAGSYENELGNGRATAILLAIGGCNVVCVDIDLSSAQRTVELIQSEPLTSLNPGPKGSAIAIQADITSSSDCEKIVSTALDTWGRLDILFNCVGTGGASGTAVDVDMVSWARGLEVNITSMVLMSKFAIPAMTRNALSLETGRNYKGVIINMGSVAGIRGGTPHLLYPTSKGAVVNMTRAMAAHHAPDGIRVNCICPGMLYTPMMYSEGRMSEDARKSRQDRSLLKTEGNAWDVAGAVRWLVSDEARWVTGVILPIDAGATCSVGTDVPNLKEASVNA